MYLVPIWSLSLLSLLVCPRRVLWKDVIPVVSMQSTQKGRCSQTVLLMPWKDWISKNKLGRACSFEKVCYVSRRRREQVELQIPYKLCGHFSTRAQRYLRIVLWHTDKSKHPWGLTSGNANTCVWVCERKTSRYIPLASNEIFRNPLNSPITHTHTNKHTHKYMQNVKPWGSISAPPGVTWSAARGTTCRSQVWLLPGKRTTQLLLWPEGEEKRGVSRIDYWKPEPFHIKLEETV